MGISLGCCQNSSTGNEIVLQEESKTIQQAEPNFEEREEVINIDKSLTRKFTFKTRQQIKTIEGRVSDFYEIKGTLGEGAYGCVRRGIHKKTGFERAIKSIMKSFVKKSEANEMLLEADMVRQLDHPNIIKIHEVIQDKRHYHIASELCTGGDLFDRVAKLTYFTENQAAKYMYQILSAIVYCHSHNIIHRDLKPENLLFQNTSRHSLLKVIDFGVSRLHTSSDSQKTKRYGIVRFT